MSKRGYTFGFTSDKRDRERRGRAIERLADSEWVSVAGGDLPQPVLVRFGKSERGTLVVTGLIVGASAEREITSRDVRNIKPAEILAALSSDESALVIPVDLRRNELGEISGTGMGKELLSHAERGASSKVVPRRRPGRKGWPDEHYREVAEVYRRALIEDSHAPFEAARKKLGASPATMRRWVGTARQKGYLGSAIPGKAGEVKQGTARGGVIVSGRAAGAKGRARSTQGKRGR